MDLRHTAALTLKASTGEMHGQQDALPEEGRCPESMDGQRKESLPLSHMLL